MADKPVIPKESVKDLVVSLVGSLNIVDGEITIRTAQINEETKVTEFVVYQIEAVEGFVAICSFVHQWLNLNGINCDVADGSENREPDQILKTLSEAGQSSAYGDPKNRMVN